MSGNFVIFLVRSEWTVSKLKEHSGYKRVRMSRIPYGKHFGDSKVCDEIT